MPFPAFSGNPIGRSGYYVEEREGSRMHVRTLTKKQMPILAESDSATFIGTWTGLMLFIIGSIFVPQKFF